MSLAVAHSRGLVGLSAPAVTVEVHLAGGLPAFHIVGLADTEVKESRERVRAALQHGGFEFPNRRITVNLAPADLPKGSGRFERLRSLLPAHGVLWGTARPTLFGLITGAVRVGLHPFELFPGFSDGLVCSPLFGGHGA